MSAVTNYVLMLPTLVDREETDLKKKLDALLPSDTKFVQVDSLTVGPKCMEATVFIAAVNFFSLPQMAEVLLAIDWSKYWFDEEGVRLAVKEQNDMAFEMYDLKQLRALLEEQHGRTNR